MKILVSDDISEKGIDLLRRYYDVDVEMNMSEPQLIECIGQYDGLVTRSMTKVTKGVIDAASKLRVIGRAGVGVDNIDLVAASEHGIIVLNTPESNTIAAAEHTMALLFSMIRHVPQAHNSIMAGEWNRSLFTGIQLYGKTIGIIGVGRIGSRISRYMKTMGMEVIGYDPYISKEREKTLDIEMVDFDSLLRLADFITLHVPLTDETKYMINEKQILKMKFGVYIVNCSRGAVVDIQALANGIRSQRVAGAALDVYPDEPLTQAGNPFLGMQNVVLTPHLGASTVEAQIGVAIEAAKGVIAALNGEFVKNAVNKV